MIFFSLLYCLELLNAKDKKEIFYLKSKPNFIDCDNIICILLSSYALYYRRSLLCVLRWLSDKQQLPFP